MSEIYEAWAEYHGYRVWGISGKWWDRSDDNESLWFWAELIQQCREEMISL